MIESGIIWDWQTIVGIVGGLIICFYIIALSVGGSWFDGD